MKCSKHPCSHQPHTGMILVGQPIFVSLRLSLCKLHLAWRHVRGAGVGSETPVLRRVREGKGESSSETSGYFFSLESDLVVHSGTICIASWSSRWDVEENSRGSSVTAPVNLSIRVNEIGCSERAWCAHLGHRIDLQSSKALQYLTNIKTILTCCLQMTTFCNFCSSWEISDPSECCGEFSGSFLNENCVIHLGKTFQIQVHVRRQLKRIVWLDVSSAPDLTVRLYLLKSQHFYRACSLNTALKWFSLI